MAPAGEPSRAGDAEGPKPPHRPGAFWLPPAASPASWRPSHRRGFRQRGLPPRPALSASSLAHRNKRPHDRSIATWASVGGRAAAERRGGAAPGRRTGAPHATIVPRHGPKAPGELLPSLNHPPCPTVQLGCVRAEHPRGARNRVVGWIPVRRTPAAAAGNRRRSLQKPSGAPPAGHALQPKKPSPRPQPVPTGSGPWARLLYFHFPCHRRNPP